MIADFFPNWIEKQKYGIVVYPADLFELRIQEEMIRADEYKSYFVYVEIDFNAIRKELKGEEAEYEFWKAFLKCLATKDRGSDVYGLLKNNTGIGLLLLDSKMEGWRRLEGRIKEFSKITLGDISEVLKKGIKEFVYPACLEKVQAIHKESK
ncbi:MAG: hypothetical protein M0P13_11880 [Fibrobacteraceae bacterium]|nr:hypothetical protein [Fibrobacteraceae bacterium]